MFSSSATSQWFANLDEIKDDAIAALGDVTFYPPQCQYNFPPYKLESFYHVLTNVRWYSS